MTPEHKAAMQAGRVAKKAAKEAREARALAKAAKAREMEDIELIDDVEDVPSARTPVREPNRTPIRAAGRGEAIGRGGEVLSRKRTQSGDIFDIPLELIPKGWEYQWCAVSVTGNTEILLDQNLMFAENGWRAVPADRYPGRFMPVGHKGSIIRGSQMLMERPKSLSDEARAEDVKSAKQLISDRNESLKLSGVKKGMADGFEMSEKYRGTGGGIRMQIDKSLDVQREDIRPQYEID